jgi:hypothetical protein
MLKQDSVAGHQTGCISTEYDMGKHFFPSDPPSGYRFSLSWDNENISSLLHHRKGGTA